MSRLLPLVLLLLSGLALAQKNPPPQLYDEPFRPQFHFSPAKNWTNDPNGLVYFDGEYHLFFQYNPFGDQWGHMTWGHAISKDLVHWEELPPAIPEENGIMIFTGSTVVDEHNTSGFCTGGKPCLVAVYTGHTPDPATGKSALQTQNLAYSNDRGRTFTKFAGNPVLDLHMKEFRDPKVFWSEQSQQWIMAVALPDDHKVAFYGSPDLKQWKHLSDFGPAGAVSGQWECPELFELPVDGDANTTRWVLKVGLNPGGRLGGSGEQYFIGKFDGTTFKNDNFPDLTLWTDWGKDCYCALTFNDLPKDRPPVMIGWMSNWQYASKLPTSPWRGQMTFPRELFLKKLSVGIRLFQRPPNVFGPGFDVSQLTDRVDKNLLGAVARGQIAQSMIQDALSHGHLLSVTAKININKAKQVGLAFFGTKKPAAVLGYDVKKRVLFLQRHKNGNAEVAPGFLDPMPVPLSLEGNELEVTVVIDRSSIEIFADGGRIAITSLVFPKSLASPISFYYVDGDPTVQWFIRRGPKGIKRTP